MGSWCGQVSSATEENINTYLSLMNGLENDYPEVTFVYMTGHVDGSGLTGNLHIRNEQIRSYFHFLDRQRHYREQIAVIIPLPLYLLYLVIQQQTWSG